jgi:predicted PurR-regulated permease PerM
MGVVVVLVLGAFLVHRPSSYRQGLLRLLPQAWEERCAMLLDQEAEALRHWVGGMLVSMTVMGTLAGLGLWLAGIHVWLLLAVLTFCGTFVPYAGAIASAVPGLVMGLAHSPAHFFYACGVYLGVHITEGYIVQPMIMKRTVELQPAMLLFWQALMGGAFGVLGVIVATPLLVTVQVLVRVVYVEGYLGKEPEPRAEAAA